ncbi:hypothetical protein H2248_010092 [Termitomyces sp. 'cryptogamus']|nr:hypothetical protein H2248_010092 [Termitomyces sp. 'cryptogamus']
MGQRNQGVELMMGGEDREQRGWFSGFGRSRVGVSGCGEGVKVGQGAVGVSWGGVGVSRNRRRAWVEVRRSVGGFLGNRGLLDNVRGSRGQVVTEVCLSAAWAEANKVLAAEPGGGVGSGGGGGSGGA